MAFPTIDGAGPKRLGEDIPPLKAQGMDFLAAAGCAGVSLQFSTLTATGSSIAVTLSTAAPSTIKNGTLRAMATATYFVGAYDETGNAWLAISAKSASGFTVASATSGHLIKVLLVGQLAGQSA